MRGAGTAACSVGRVHEAPSEDETHVQPAALLLDPRPDPKPWAGHDGALHTYLVIDHDLLALYRSRRSPPSICQRPAAPGARRCPWWVGVGAKLETPSTHRGFC